MNVGSGPEDLPQFEDWFLYHLVDTAGDRPMGHTEGVPETDVAVRLADELEVPREFFEGAGYLGSTVHDVISGTIQELEDEGLLMVPIKDTGAWDLRPTRDGRRRVAQWREEWERSRSKRDREVQRLILRELERQWRADPEMYKLRSHLDVDRFCEENDVAQDVYLANVHRLLEQGKIATMSVDQATPASGNIYITESGRRALEAAETTPKPQRDAQEAWVETARLKRRLQIAERSLPSLIADDELRRRCEDLLAADEHHDRVVREASVILEDRVRKAIGAGKNVVGVPLMQKAFSPNNNLLRLSDHDQEQVGAMQIYSGVMAFFRNEAGHNLIETYGQEDALRFVVFVDLLLAMVRRATEAHREDDTA
jgi:uncharacterized protein (TIGR02391 family)